MEIYFPKDLGENEKNNSHIQICICFHHEEAHEHSHDRLDQKICPIALIFHTSIVGEAYYPSHLKLLPEAEKKRVRISGF